MAIPKIPRRALEKDGNCLILKGCSDKYWKVYFVGVLNLTYCNVKDNSV